jgi:hypothetical protein
MRGSDERLLCATARRRTSFSTAWRDSPDENTKSMKPIGIKSIRAFTAAGSALMIMRGEKIP